ncbi:hypothetical protein J4436_02815 [Candidatus Woesearchaeota archaeon]|nr:hypothetical protein [Candidatus Woesearchaeota archaeon]
MKKYIILFLLILVTVTAERQNQIFDNELKLELTNYDPSPIVPGEESNIVFDAINVGAVDLNNIVLQIQEKFPFSMVSDREITINSLKIGERKSFSFKIKTDHSTNNGTYSIGISYLTNTKGIVEVKEFAIDIQKSNLIITPTNVRIEPERINPGDTAVIFIDLENSGDFALKDINIRLDLTDQPFAPIEDTAERNIKLLNINDKASTQFKIISLADAETKIYKVPLRISYVDETGKKYEKEESIGLIVDANPSFQINLENANIYKLEQAGKVTISISNIAPTDVKFVSLELLESDYYQILSNQREYIGNLDSDDYETVEFQIYAMQIKEDNFLPLRLKIKYKDAYNNEKEFEEEIKLNVYSNWEAVKYGLEKPNTTYLKFIISILLLLFIWSAYREWQRTKNIWSAIGNTFVNTFKSLFINPWKKNKNVK